MESYSQLSRSDIGGGIGSDSFYDRVGVGPLYKRKQLETPRSELYNYLNWVPQKEKINMAAIQKTAKQVPSTLTPIRPQRLDDERSKTVLKIRDRYSNRSVVNEIKANMAIDGYSINGDNVKPRAMSQLRTFDN